MHSKRAYFSLALSPFASQLGSAIYILGLNWLIVQATGNTKLLGWIEGLGGFAFLLGDFLVGSLVDQHNRKTVLIGTDVISGLACLIGSFLLNSQHPQVWLLILITAILNLMLAINFPAAKAIAPEIIPAQFLQRFNAIANTLFNFANVFAPLIGGSLLAIKSIDFNEFLIINACSYLAAILLNGLIPYHYETKSNNQPNQSAFKSTLLGLQYIKKHPILMINMLAMGIFNFCYAGFMLTAPYVGHHFFGGQSNHYSLFLTIAALGGLLGGLWLTLQKRQITAKTIYREQLFYGLILMICGLFLSLPSWLLIALTFGIVQARFFGGITTFIQQETDLPYLGRIFGVTFLFFDGVQPLGDFIFGPFISIWHQWTYVILGSIISLSFLLLLHLNRRV
ncbi:MAG: MFS transporter [Lentilactobacillus diolivorans]|uniref:MFS transporter n=1 Tax=Lentilactobacillus diolivorans TaxID=179838 RepID=UPI0039ED2B96